MNTSDTTGPFKSRNIFAPGIALGVCFLIVVISINGIINLAQPKVTTQAAKTNEQYWITLSKLTQNQEPLDYKQLKAISSTPYAPQLLQERFSKINPQIEQLPPSEQSQILRLNILEWGLEQSQKQLNELSKATTQSLIFKLGFWIYCILLWGASIIGAQLLKRLTDKFFDKWREKASTN